MCLLSTGWLSGAHLRLGRLETDSYLGSWREDADDAGENPFLKHPAGKPHRHVPPLIWFWESWVMSSFAWRFVCSEWNWNGFRSTWTLIHSDWCVKKRLIVLNFTQHYPTFCFYLTVFAAACRPPVDTWVPSTQSPRWAAFSPGCVLVYFIILMCWSH